MELFEHEHRQLKTKLSILDAAEKAAVALIARLGWTAPSLATAVNLPYSTAYELLWKNKAEEIKVTVHRKGCVTFVHTVHGSIKRTEREIEFNELDVVAQYWAQQIPQLLPAARQPVLPERET